MKRTLIIIICAISFGISQRSVAQSYSDLDNKGGFNKFKLGSTLKECKKQANLSRLPIKYQDRNLEAYSVKDINNYTLFSYELQEIRLIFFKDLLYDITVKLYFYRVGSPEAKIVYEDVYQKIKEQYGEFVTSPPVPRDALDNIATRSSINGNRVYLGRTTFNQTNGFQPGDEYRFISRHVNGLREKETHERTNSGL